MSSKRLQESGQELDMKKPRTADLSLTRVGVPDREANRQLVWTVGWTFTFLVMSIFFLQGA